MSLKQLVQRRAIKALEKDKDAVSSTTETKEPEPFLLIKSATPIGSGRFFYKLDTNQGVYYYTPTEFVERGLVQGSNQFFDQGFLRYPDVFKSAKPVTVESGFLPGMESAGYENPNTGILMNQDQAKYLLGGGKDIFSDWDNDVSNGGYVDLYDINSLSNIGNPLGAIQGIGQIDGQYVYVRPTASGWESSYIVPYDQYDNGYSMRDTRVEYKGIFGSKVAKSLANVAKAVGQVPFLTELTAAIPVVGPAVYGTLKGAQAGISGKDPLEAALETGASMAVAQGIKSLLPSGAGAFGGDVEAQPGGFYGESTALGGAVGPAPGVDVTAIGTPATPDITQITGAETLGGVSAPGVGAEAISIGAPAVPDITQIAGSDVLSGGVAPGAGTEVIPLGDVITPEITPIPPTTPEFPSIPAESLVNEIAKQPTTQVFDDGSKLQIFNDGSSIATDTAGNVSSSIATDIVQPGFVDPNAPGFGFQGEAPAPIETRDVGPYDPGSGKSTTESLWGLAKTAGETAYGLATDYPMTTLGLATAISGAGQPDQPQAPIEQEPAKKTYSYRSPIQYKPSQGLQELFSAAEGIYGQQLPPMQLPQAAPAPATQQIAPMPLLGGQAPGGIVALRPTYTPISGGPAVDIGKLSIDQIIQLQNALEGKRLGALA